MKIIQKLNAIKKDLIENVQYFEDRLEADKKLYKDRIEKDTKIISSLKAELQETEQAISILSGVTDTKVYKAMHGED